MYVSEAGSGFIFRYCQKEGREKGKELPTLSSPLNKGRISYNCYKL